MESEPVLFGLIRKRSQIAGSTERLQHALREHVIELDAIDKAFKDPSSLSLDELDERYHLIIAVMKEKPTAFKKSKSGL